MDRRPGPGDTPLAYQARMTSSGVGAAGAGAAAAGEAAVGSDAAEAGSNEGGGRCQGGCGGPLIGNLQNLLVVATGVESRW